jgi:hypothetical protein
LNPIASLFGAPPAIMTTDKIMRPIMAISFMEVKMNSASPNIPTAETLRTRMNMMMIVIHTAG